MSTGCDCGENNACCGSWGGGAGGGLFVKREVEDEGRVHIPAATYLCPN